MIDGTICDLYAYGRLIDAHETKIAGRPAVPFDLGPHVDRKRRRNALHASKNISETPAATAAVRAKHIAF